MAEPIQVDFEGRKRKKAGPKPAVIPPERAGLRIILSIVGALITAVVAYYFMLPPINLRAKEFYMYLLLVIGSFVVLMFLLCRAGSRPEYMPYVRKKVTIPLIAIGVIVVFFGVAWVISSPFFNARKYAAIMDVNEETSFANDIDEQDFSAIPKLDESAATQVANRTLGDLADFVSQFTISASNTQINYREKPVRVMTLAYADIIKWFTNTSAGLPGYVIVDMASEQSEFVRLEENIRYTDTEHFGRLLKRHLRFEFPTSMFGTPTFEINDEGHPFWIAPVVTKTIGLLGGEDVIGIVLVDAVTGECTQYDIETVREQKDLQWIDRVYSATLLTEQFNYYGKYSNGFWNSLLGQKGVKTTTQGFNYLAQDDDVLMYTGVTSVTADSSIIGFILVNQRTKEANFYTAKGATENSAQQSAMGLVSDYKWSASFPLLINSADHPTYFLSLKDESNVVQGYSMVNVEQYNKIKVWGKTLSECTAAYTQALRDNGINTPAPTDPADPVDPVDPVDPNGEEPTTPAVPSGDQTVTGKISDIRSEVLSGNTTYYIQLEGSTVYYVLIGGGALLNRGDNVTVTYTPSASSTLPTAKSVVPAG